MAEVRGATLIFTDWAEFLPNLNVLASAAKAKHLFGVCLAERTQVWLGKTLCCGARPFVHRFSPGQPQQKMCHMADGTQDFEDGVQTEGVAADKLRLLIERVERLEEDKKAVMEDIKEVYAEAKGEGFDTKIMRQVVRIRKMEAHDRQEQEALLDLYLAALGER